MGTWKLISSRKGILFQTAYLDKRLLSGNKLLSMGFYLLCLASTKLLTLKHFVLSWDLVLISPGVLSHPQSFSKQFTCVHACSWEREDLRHRDSALWIQFGQRAQKPIARQTTVHLFGDSLYWCQIRWTYLDHDIKTPKAKKKYGKQWNSKNNSAEILFSKVGILL